MNKALEDVEIEGYKAKDILDGLSPKELMKLYKDIKKSIKIIGDSENIGDYFKEYGLTEADFDIDKSGDLDIKEKSLYNKYVKTQDNIMKFSEKTVKGFGWLSLAFNILLSVVFLLVTILA